MINYIKNLFKVKTKWIPAKLGGIAYLNNPYDFGLCPIVSHNIAVSMLRILPSLIEYDESIKGYVTGRLALEIFGKKKLEREKADLKEVQEFIKTNISFFSQEIINKYVIEVK